MLPDSLPVAVRTDIVVDGHADLCEDGVEEPETIAAQLGLGVDMNFRGQGPTERRRVEMQRLCSKLTLELRSLRLVCFCDDNCHGHKVAAPGYRAAEDRGLRRPPPRVVFRVGHYTLPV